MPSISCLSPKVKEDLLGLLRKGGASDRDLKLVGSIPACPAGDVGITSGRGERVKRLPSQYNLFVKECVGERKKDFRACASEWNQKKAKLGPNGHR